MESPLHAHDRYALEVAEDHLTCMTLDSGDREMRNLLVREALLVLERLRQGTWTQLVLLI